MECEQKDLVENEKEQWRLQQKGAARKTIKNGYRDIGCEKVAQKVAKSWLIKIQVFIIFQLSTENSGYLRLLFCIYEH